MFTHKRPCEKPIIPPKPPKISRERTAQREEQSKGREEVSEVEDEIKEVKQDSLAPIRILGQNMEEFEKLLETIWAPAYVTKEGSGGIVWCQYTIDNEGSHAGSQYANAISKPILHGMVKKWLHEVDLCFQNPPEVWPPEYYKHAIFLVLRVRERILELEHSGEVLTCQLNQASEARGEIAGVGRSQFDFKKLATVAGSVAENVTDALEYCERCLKALHDQGKARYTAGYFLLAEDDRCRIKRW